MEAAGEHFSHYGYEKTTVSDLAKAIGFSKAYIYKFFDSKQAIGEAICSKTLSAIVAAVEEAVAGATTPTEKFRRMFKALVDDRRESVLQRSQAVRHRRVRRRRAVAVGPRLRGAHQADPDARSSAKVARPASSSARRRWTRRCMRSIWSMQPYVNPLLLQHNLDCRRGGAGAAVQPGAAQPSTVKCIVVTIDNISH